MTNSPTSLLGSFNALWDACSVDITRSAFHDGSSRHPTDALDLFDLNPDWGTFGEDIFEEDR
jgi:hypothetical protein